MEAHLLVCKFLCQFGFSSVTLCKFLVQLNKQRLRAYLHLGTTKLRNRPLKVIPNDFFPGLIVHVESHDHQAYYIHKSGKTIYCFLCIVSVIAYLVYDRQHRGYSG